MSTRIKFMNTTIQFTAIATAALIALAVFLPKPTHHFRTELTISAAREQVWSVLTAAELYPNWNPLVSHMEGALIEGATLKVTINSGNGSSMDFTPKPIVYTPGHELTWLGQLGLPGVFDGKHRFAVESLPDGNTRFVHEEHFSGILVPLLRGKLKRDSLPLFTAMNLVLKSRVESSALLAQR